MDPASLPENPASPPRSPSSVPSEANSAKVSGPAAAAGRPAGRGFFLPGEAASAFSHAFLSADACRCWILRRLHPGGASCPRCGLTLEGATDLSFWSGRRCSCGRCGRWFTATTDTFLRGAQFDFRQVYLLAVLIDILGPGFDAARVAGIVGVSPDTVRLWCSRFRELGEDEKGADHE